MKQKLGFLEAYKGKASDEMFEKTALLLVDLQRNNLANSFLTKGHEYKRKEFREHHEYGVKAYDLILAADIARRALLIFSAFSVMSFLETTSWDKSGEQPQTIVSKVAKANWSICNHLHQTCDAVFQMVLKGNDLSARILARSVIEASDYWLAIQDDQKLCEEYVEAGENFNNLWYTKLRSTKLARLRKKSLLKVFENDKSMVDEISGYKDESYSDFSMAAHPSYESGIMDILSHRPFWPESEENNFLDEWPHQRVMICTVDTSMLPLMTALMKMIGSKSSALQLPYLDSGGKNFGAEEAAALLKFGLLAAASVTQYPHRFESKK